MKIEDSLQNVEDWLNGTGAVCLKEGTSIDDFMNSLCIHYYNLKPFMMDGPSTNPIFLLVPYNLHKTLY